jgi:hypothetical protein
MTTSLTGLTGRVFAKDQLSRLVDAGVKGFKCFMIDSGVEVGWPLVGMHKAPLR